MAVLFFLCLHSVPALGDVFWWLDDDEPEEEAIIDTAEGPEIHEPFFAFMIALAEGDSLGTWSGDTIVSRIKASGYESRFPVEQIISLTRRPAAGQEMEYRLSKNVSRIWELDLAEYLDRSMPYSILGYHPGSLLVSQRLIFSEWGLGHLDLLVPSEDKSHEVEPLENVLVMRLDEGHIVLDVDGWIDAILGKGLDDSWTLGLVLARHQGSVMGLAVCLGRDDRHIYGEIDFKTDKILPHGAPLASALSRHCRRFTAPHPSSTNIPWPEDD